jgi:hypothetical protein
MNPHIPIPFTVTDPDAPVPYRLRVLAPSQELRDFVVPRLGISSIPEERPSGARLRASAGKPSAKRRLRAA